MSDITIYHNPNCGTSRNTLALIRNSGAEPRIVEYLKTPPGREELLGLIAALGLPVREVMRSKEALYQELDLANPAQSDEALGQWIRQNADTIYHPVGTCRMGVDDMAVVDHELRVRGVQGLRVVDASVMPRIVSGNTNAPTIMIAEKAADLMRSPPGKPGLIPAH